MVFATNNTVTFSCERIAESREGKGRKMAQVHRRMREKFSLQTVAAFYRAHCEPTA
jgi:hypothetical protein